MEEREINKILTPKKRLIILFLFCLCIAFVFISVVFIMRFDNGEEAILNLSELVSSNDEKEGKYVELESNSLPVLMTGTYDKDNHFYYVKDIDNNIYIVNISNKTFENITEMIDKETGKLNSNYHIKGVTQNIDEQIKELALINSYKILKNNELNSNNFSEYFDEIYVKDSSISERVITLYKISALIGILFLILALCYILPSILKVRKTFTNQELVNELRIELENLNDTTYKKYHIYLTKNYIISGIEAIKYEDIIGANIWVETSYGIKIGKNLIVYTRDNKKHIIASVRPKDDVLEELLNDIYSKNNNIIVGYESKDI